MEYNTKLTIGKEYRNRNGWYYLCTSGPKPECYTMVRTSDGWTLVAHIITMYEDGTIEWNYSTGGHWEEQHNEDD